ncbi:phospho-N-acetylmuramoyl-pentapeptide-transferase [Selenomonas sp. oral taxon 892 str. F0426]|uniref:phospho-N-acetylmuramoyl-pentapeptide- transferase n=1 Tax=Selenomonas sp. oral taxon 892 TaxID=1321785 RepID=UPI0003ACE10D|nr:phospho-N-acetylmuramoyl-pentapeptide-transferase [Selenomonas sp. oral taxon 892]ERJ95390.1 phospho-N-acetylmuramoyl-pentapeptide-transferase [Selenomonas sp. oral taxon 892 str. F0426]
MEYISDLSPWLLLLLTLVTALAIVLFSGVYFLPFLHRLKYGQSIREEGPASHQKKNGTPTMGGVMIVLAVTLSTLLFAPLTVTTLLALFIFLGHFLLGFADDYIKVVKKRNLGLRAYQKLLGQLLISLVTILIGRSLLGHDTSVWVPILGEMWDIGVLYYVLVVFVLVGTSNAVNLTDGLDGLASGTVAAAAIFYAVLMYGTDHGLMVFSAAIIGACIGFLWYNHHPARIFMGDTGSLALGGALAAVAILSHTEALLPIVGFVFVCEALSVILQVISFQTRGKRIFRMSPIHHHFELGGWSETRVVYTFWAVGATGALLAWIVVLIS